MRLSSNWTKHLSKQGDKKEFRDHILVSRKVLERLECLLDEKTESSLKQCENIENYEKPAWAEFQADQLGYRRAMREIKGLLNIKWE